MISLLTDFGVVDPYVAQMKAVILSCAPTAAIVDISHGVEKYNIAMGAYLLKTTVPWFPKGSVHLAVVDPGVGSARMPIAIECDRGVLIGPDNGLLVSAADVLGLRGAYKITRPEFMNETVSSTFHGRDVFARVAAMIAGGRQPREVGASLDRLVHLDPPIASVSQGHVSCHVAYVDSFGNLVTDLTSRQLEGFKLRKGKHAEIGLNGQDYQCVFVDSYTDIPRGRVGLLFGSQGQLELARQEESVAALFKLRVGDSIRIRFK